MENNPMIKSGADEDNMVLLDRRDLFDAVRGAIREAMIESGAYACESEAFGKATDAATNALRDLVEKGSVPPAGGEVEVWYVDNPEDCTTGVEVVSHSDYLTNVTRLQAENAQLIVDCWQACGGNGPANRDDLLAALRLMNEAEDELTAERDALKADSKRLAELDDQTIKKLGDKLRESQSELTKARELLKESESWMDTQEYVEPGSIWGDLHTGVKDFLARQSAPAAKGGE